MVQQKTKTGLADLCIKHYDDFHIQAARDWCAGHGFSKREDESSEEWINRMRAYVKKIAAEIGTHEFNAAHWDKWAGWILSDAEQGKPHSAVVHERAVEWLKKRSIAAPMREMGDDSDADVYGSDAG